MYNKQKQHFFNIADFNICVQSQQDDLKIKFSENYLSFGISSTNKIDLSIVVYKGVSNSLYNAPKVFSAKHAGSENDESYFWSIHKTEKGYAVLTSDPGSTVFPYLALAFNRTSKHWEMYVSQEYIKNSENIDPFLYPMGPLLMYYLATLNNAFMIHASAVKFNNKAYVFSGKSGIGKSTMADLWKMNGAEIINDDRLIIRQINKNFFVYNTPMYYPDKPKKAILESVFLLHQEKENSIEQLTMAKAISNILANCIQHDYDKILVNNLIDILTNLISSVPIYRLGFKPDNSIFEFIKNERKKQ